LRKHCVLFAAVLLAVAALPADSPKLEFSWRNPAYTGGTFKNIMVLALNGKAENRAEFEDELVAALTAPGQSATQSYQFVPRPDGTPLDTKDLRLQIRDNKFDAIVVGRLTKRIDRSNYVPGEVYTPYPYYSTFYGYYSALAPVIYVPGYMETEKEAQVEVNVYTTAKPDGELVWTGTTNTFDAKSPMKVIHDLVRIVCKQLETDNLVVRKPD
jgi:hypothetical protein